MVPGSAVKEATLQSAVAVTGNGGTLDVIDPSQGAFVIAIFQVTGTFVATVTLEGSVDGTNWFAILAENLTDGAEATTVTAAGVYRANVLGLAKVRGRVTWTSGTSVTVFARLVA